MLRARHGRLRRHPAAMRTGPKKTARASALQFVLNYEEGGEANVLHGDAGSSSFCRKSSAPRKSSARHMSMESLRIRFPRRRLAHVARIRGARPPLTIFGVAMALPRNPELATDLVARGHEIVRHGLR